MSLNIFSITKSKLNHMQKSLIIISLIFLASCSSAPKWESYSYQDEIVRVQNGQVITEHEQLIDTSQLEFVISTNCTIAEASAHEQHAKKKFKEFKEKMAGIRPFGSDFCVGSPEKSVEFNFITKEQGSIHLDWGIEMQKFVFTDDSIKTRINTIGYVLRTGHEQAVMYEVGQDSTTKYYGYNNVLYAKLMDNLPN